MVASPHVHKVREPQTANEKLDYVFQLTFQFRQLIIIIPRNGKIANTLALIDRLLEDLAQF